LYGFEFFNHFNIGEGGIRRVARRHSLAPAGLGIRGDGFSAHPHSK